MTCFVRKIAVRMVAMAAIGSGLNYSTTPNDLSVIRYSYSVKNTSFYDAQILDYETSTLFPARDNLLWSWINMLHMLPRPSFLCLDSSSSENFPFLFSRFASAESAPPGDTKKEDSSEVGDDIKPCCGCFGSDTLANAAARVGPAVVNLSIPRGYPGPDAGNSMGSGTIIDKNGTILTSFHLVKASESLSTSLNGKVEVTLQDGRTFEGTVVKAHVHSKIAIIKINSTSPLPSAKLGSSRKLRPGEWVVAVGCPISVQSSITAGNISCVDCKGSDLGIGGMQREYLQTNCAINEGFCGGPLVNMDGEVIAVNIMKVAAGDGLGISLSIDAISKSLENFITKGRVVRPWLGLRLLDIDETIVANIKERDPSFPCISKGVLVSVVVPGSPADRSGFRPADVITEFDGIPLQSINEIADILRDKAGKPIKVRVKRSNDVSVTLTVIAEEAFDL